MSSNSYEAVALAVAGAESSFAATTALGEAIHRGAKATFLCCMCLLSCPSSAQLLVFDFLEDTFACSLLWTEHSLGDHVDQIRERDSPHGLDSADSE